MVVLEYTGPSGHAKFCPPNGLLILTNPSGGYVKIRDPSAPLKVITEFTKLTRSQLSVLKYGRNVMTYQRELPAAIIC